MKTTLVLTLEHKKPLPDDMLDIIGGRIYTAQALDQSAGSVQVQTIAEFINSIDSNIKNPVCEGSRSNERCNIRGVCTCT